MGCVFSAFDSVRYSGSDGLPTIDHPSATAMNLNVFRLTAAVLLSTGAVACTSDVNSPFAPPGLSLTFSPDLDTLFLADSGGATPVHLSLSATSLGQPVTTPSGVEWTVADTTIAVVDSTGAVRPVGLGSTTVTARVNSEKAHATIVVVRPVTHVVVTPSVLTGVVGDTTNVVASALDANGSLVAGTAYTFTVADPSTVSLTRTSTRTATAVFLKAGPVRIDVTADGKVGSATGTIQLP